MPKTSYASEKSELLSQTTSFYYTISPCELDVMAYTLFHHAGVTHQTKHKEKPRMGFRLPKIVIPTAGAYRSRFSGNCLHYLFRERKESDSEDLQRKTVYLIQGTSAKGKNPIQTRKKNPNHHMFL